MFKHLDNYADDCSPGVSDTQGKEIRELDGDVYDDDDDAAPDAIVAKSVKISTSRFLSQKISTKNTCFTTFLNL